MLHQAKQLELVSTLPLDWQGPLESPGLVTTIEAVVMESAGLVIPIEAEAMVVEPQEQATIAKAMVMPAVESQEQAAIVMAMVMPVVESLELAITIEAVVMESQEQAAIIQAKEMVPEC